MTAFGFYFLLQLLLERRLLLSHVAYWSHLVQRFQSGLLKWQWWNQFKHLWMYNYRL